MKQFWIFILLICSMVFLLRCNHTSSSDIAKQETIDESIEMLESVFEGPYSATMIKEKMDILFLRYDISLERKNYLKIGNELVTFKKVSKGQYVEMDIITLILESKSHNYGISYNEQLIWSVEQLDSQYAINK